MRLWVYAPAWVTVAVMLGLAQACDFYLNLDWFGPDQIRMLFAYSTFGLLFVAFVKLLAQASERMPAPQLWAWRPSGETIHALMMPVLAAPLFLIGFSVVKCSMAIAVGFRWDKSLANLDRFFFGTDTWVLTRAVLGPAPLLQWPYVAWSLAIPAAQFTVACFCDATANARFHFAMFLTWLVAGIFVAYCFSSAGPAFADIISPELAHRFAGLKSAIARDAPNIALAQEVLRAGYADHRIFTGRGISAMPSIHVASTAILVFAFWRHPNFRVPALIFSALVWLGSVQFGWHYAIDGLVGYLVAGLCWRASQLVCALSALEERSKKILVPTG